MREDPMQLKLPGGHSEFLERLRTLARTRWDRRSPQEKRIAEDEIHDPLRALGILEGSIRSARVEGRSFGECSKKSLNS